MGFDPTPLYLALKTDFARLPVLNSVKHIWDRIGEVFGLPFHTTVRTVRYTAVHKFSQTFWYWPNRDGYPARASLSFVMTELSIFAALHGPFLQFAISWTFHSSTRSLRSIL